jgi:nucleoside-diphosphate-sugar epimerase
MTILVTGAGGMVGSHMVELLHNRGENVIGTYYKPTTNIKELPEEIKMIECDMRYPANIEKIIMEYKPKQIYHLAAQSYPTVSWDRPYETIETNINGTIAVYEAIKKVRRLNDKDYDPIVVVACSIAEYGETLNQLEGN